MTASPAARRPLHIRVPAPRSPEPAPLDMGDPADAADAIRLTTRFVERAGRPWFPIMGEYHFSRDLPEHWETELRKMRAGGVNVVATYVLWILHEETRGDVRWDGANDLRRFVETADRVGLKVVLRIGPWAHGETRNGGFPDWLQELPIAHRTDAPEYLALVRDWFDAIGRQVAGLFHDDRDPAAPIIGVQVENELYDQPDHLATLRDLAEAAGMRASLWTATGWGGAQLPARRVLPVYAGYSDGFWEESTTGWPEFGRMHFTFSTVRDDLTVGADLRDAPATGVAADAAEDPWPFATCELGGGMQVAYHRRPHVDPADVAALALVKLGSGSAWPGYYLYHGGTQVLGERSTTQESQATGYPNDVPVRDYDFFAPIGGAGQQRPHFHALRRQHLLLEAFGERLAPWPAAIPDQSAENGENGENGLRWSVRAGEESGWLFVNNHQPAAAPLDEVPDVQFHVELAAAPVTVPTEPFTLRRGVFAVWPLRQRFGDLPAVTATAQPITQVATGEGVTVFLAATPGVPVELQLAGVSASEVSGARVVTAQEPERGGVVVTPDARPGLDCRVTARGTTFVILDPETADAVWKGPVAGEERVVLWRGDGWFDGDRFRVVPGSEGDRVLIHPALAGDDGLFTRVPVGGADGRRALPTPSFAEKQVAPVRVGGPARRLSAPTEEDFASLESVPVDIPDECFEDVERLVLSLRWTGDVLRISAGDLLIMDQFWSGRALEVDLLPYRDLIRRHGLSLRAFAWAPDSGVHVDPRVRPSATEPLLEVHEASVRAVRSQRVP
ncbi:beta-galactosidase [Microbacterium oryzae]|uniref:beta-galactosidase n=1 Tax=Microbacterium oryzae TaxID=743009 RepID=UPI00156476B9|nr:beta-galactosidase [Microbacterium oryzae]